MKITGPGTKANGGSGHGAFNRSGGAMQSQLLEKQDEQLDTMHDGAVRLGELSDAIGAELEDQGRKLDALGSDMDKVQSGMDHVMGKMEELLQVSTYTDRTIQIHVTKHTLFAHIQECSILFTFKIVACRDSVRVLLSSQIISCMLSFS